MGRNLLELLGYDVISCTESIEALKIFKQNPDSFDLVVTDQTMPMMSGVELASEIMKSGRRSLFSSVQATVHSFRNRMQNNWASASFF